MHRLSVIRNQLSACPSNAASLSLKTTAATVLKLSSCARVCVSFYFFPLFILNNAWHKKTTSDQNGIHGGHACAYSLVEQQVDAIFTLTGGHISPIIVACKQYGVRVIDVRDEATAVFAADAYSRLTGKVGVAVVTAGPGLTNTITAVKNSQMAESPLLVIAGATSTLLKGRGSLQDIDQVTLMKPLVKVCYELRTVRDILPTMRKAFYYAQRGVAGPVFLEFPLEVLWPKDVVRSMVGIDKMKTEPWSWWSPASMYRALSSRARNAYTEYYLTSVYRGIDSLPFAPPRPRTPSVRNYFFPASSSSSSSSTSSSSSASVAFPPSSSTVTSQTTTTTTTTTFPSANIASTIDDDSSFTELPAVTTETRSSVQLHTQPQPKTQSEHLQQIQYESQPSSLTVYSSSSPTQWASSLYSSFSSASPKLGGESVWSEMKPSLYAIYHTHKALSRAKKPVLIIGSQAIIASFVCRVLDLQQCVVTLSMPVYLSGMARGLIGKTHSLLMKYQRKTALAEADFVLLLGVPMDFRLGYGRGINRNAFLSVVNRNSAALNLNKDIRKPDILSESDPLNFLFDLSSLPDVDARKWTEWIDHLSALSAVQEQKTQRTIQKEMKAAEANPKLLVHPILLCDEMNKALSNESVIVCDGGDIVGQASYIVQPRQPLCWLDPGPFGTLGCGAGFALAASLCRRNSEVWLLWGDGACGWGLVEFDTFVRHQIPVIAVVGNDATWMQMYRDQVRILKDAVATELSYTHYEQVVQGFGAEGLLVTHATQLAPTFARAKRLYAQGKAVLINVMMEKVQARSGSLSL